MNSVNEKQTDEIKIIRVRLAGNISNNLGWWAAVGFISKCCHFSLFILVSFLSSLFAERLLIPS
jgi:hypothetical protein